MLDSFSESNGEEFIYETFSFAEYMDLEDITLTEECMDIGKIVERYYFNTNCNFKVFIAYLN
jgi:hypothetical protein